MNSINTNVGAMVALSNLNSVNSDLDKVQNRVSTGLKVSSAKQDASIFAVAQGIRADLKAFEAVGQALSAGQGVVSVAISSATEMSNLMQDVKAKLVQLSDASLTAQQRSIYRQDLTQMRQQLSTFAAQASYNGVNILTSGAANVEVISGTDGSVLTIRAQDLDAAIDTFRGVDAGATAAAAQGSLTAGGSFNTLFAGISDALGDLGADNRKLSFQMTFNTAISDATDEGLGALVDADLAKESAKLTALQTKQQLSVQTLSIANQGPQILLSLFQ